VTISGADFAGLLEEHRIEFSSGVPCSLIEDVIATLETHPRLPYVPAVREDVAVGMAAGAWFAGRRPAVLMQNSGLGTSLNALASLSLMYGLPALLLVTWRGHAGKDAPEHILMGEISPRLLNLLGIPHRVLSAESVGRDLVWAAAEMDRLQQPVALLVPPGVVETGRGHGAAPAAPEAPSAPPVAAEQPLVPQISRLAALAAALKPLGREPLVHANGYICRESFSLGDRPQNFYMIGSMGLAPAIGLGIALARPDRMVVVFDGDGNLLMNLGILAQVGARQPANLVHCVFDNEVYGSTGNQSSPSRHVRLDRLAGAAGYRTSVGVTSAADLESAMRTALWGDGPHFILAKVTREEAEVGRIPFTPNALRDRFRAAILAG
jgi:phosphonopyruvate decarboxylase